MIEKNTRLDYALLTILSTGKKSCQNMAQLIDSDGKKVAKLRNSTEINLGLLSTLAITNFWKEKLVIITIDDTLIDKFYAKEMVGAGLHFSTEINREIMAYKLLIMCATNGKTLVPLKAEYLFPAELLDEPQSKEELVQSMIKLAKKIFKDKEIIVVVDGVFATIVFFRWCKKHGIKAETRMHSNRKVKYKGKMVAIKDIEILKPKGLKMSRTIRVIWHHMILQITADRRIDKHGEESIVYQAATYKAKPAVHAKNYKRRWGCEKMHRTTKQYLGLEDCYSTKMSVQLAHVSSVLLAYALVQIEMKEKRFNNPEDTIRALRRKKFNSLKVHFSSLNQIFDGAHA
jgi:hypothetical protein